MTVTTELTTDIIAALGGDKQARADIAALPKPTASSTGAPAAGKAVVLNGDGAVGFDLLAGGKAYANMPQVVFGPGNFPPPDDNGNGTVGAKAPAQFVQSMADPQLFGAQYVMYGPGRGGWRDLYVSTPGANPSDFSVPVALGGLIRGEYYQGSTGNGQTGHVGSVIVIVDGDQMTFGEVAGRINFNTGTGKGPTTDAAYYGVQLALALNSKQQAFFAGARYAKQRLANQNVAYGAGADFGGIIRIGPGGTAPSEAPFKNDIANTGLLLIPEPGAVEYDNDNNEWRTDAAGNRKMVVAVKPLMWSTFVDDGLAVRTLRSGGDWAEITVAVGNADIQAPGTEIARLNLPVALAANAVPAIASFNMRWPGGVGRTADCYAYFRGSRNALSIVADSGKLLANQTYVFTLLFR